MPLRFVSGDPFLSQAQVLAFGFNILGRAEVDPFHTNLIQRYPAAFASYGRQCRQQRIHTGQFWLWRENRPMLGFMVVRASPVGATRIRYVESIALSLARDYRREGIASMAIAPLGTALEWPALKPVLERWLDRSNLDCVVYETYQPGVVAE